MTGVKEMTVPAGKLSCDQGCKNTFRSSKGHEKHMKKKHVDAVQGTSKQTSNQDVRVTNQDEEADIDEVQADFEEDKDDQELYDIL